MQYVLPSAPNKIEGECYQGKVNFSDNATFNYNIFNDNTEKQFKLSKLLVNQ